MKNSGLKVLFVFFLLIILIFIWFGSILHKVDYSIEIPQERPCPRKEYFNIFPYIQNIDKSNMASVFPFKLYLDSANICDINSIRKDLIIMDSVNSRDLMLNRQTLSIALTTKLEERINQSFNKYNPDSLITIIQWAEKFNSYADIDENNSMLFQVIYTHWMKFVSNELRNYYQTNPAVKYNYKFKYINNRCKEMQFGSPVSFSDSEKVIKYIIENNWTHLFSRLCFDSGILTKLMILIIFIIVILPYIYIYRSRQKNRRI